jgi:hypothetical protein
MWNSTSRFLLATLVMAVVVLFTASRARATQKEQEPGNKGSQETLDPKATPRVVLAEASGEPGTSVEVPIYFTPAHGVKVGRLKLTISYVSANLKYSKLDRETGLNLETPDLQIDVKDGKDDKGIAMQTLTITASYQNSRPPEGGIPEGLLGYLTLQISETGRAAKIALRVTVEGSEVGTNSPISNIRAINGQVEVSVSGQPAAVSCFFFSH